MRFDPQRRERVDALRSAVAGGRYPIDPEAIARSLLRRIPWHELL